MKDFIRILLSVILLPAYLIADDPDNQNAPAPEDTKPEIKEEQNEEEQNEEENEDNGVLPTLDELLPIDQIWNFVALYHL